MSDNKLVVPFGKRESHRVVEPDYDMIHQYCYNNMEHIKREYAETQPARWLDDIKHAFKYQKLAHRVFSSTHWGQLKLAISELAFLHQYAGHDQVYMLYVGSAPNEHFYTLPRHFPNVKFIFFDPNEHYILYPNGKNMYDSEYVDDILSGGVNKSIFG